MHAILRKPCPREELLRNVEEAVAPSRDLRAILAPSPLVPVEAGRSRTVETPSASLGGQSRADPETSASTGSPCPRCGDSALALLGETRHSIVSRCTACGQVSVDRRR